MFKFGDDAFICAVGSHCYDTYKHFTFLKEAWWIHRVRKTLYRFGYGSIFADHLHLYMLIVSGVTGIFQPDDVNHEMVRNVSHWLDI